MSWESSDIVDAPIDEVIRWHERPGALHRLMPPWQPLTVQQEAENVSDGQAILRLPGGFKWVAQHRDHVPNERFTDELTSLPLRWRHTHEFWSLGSHRTRITDRIATPVPGRLLRSTFEYRRRQLRDDLAVAARTKGPLMTVAVTGASGLVGNALCAQLTTCGHEVVRLVRRSPSTSLEREWNPDDPAPDLLRGIDAVVHLAGEPIAGRFTDSHRDAIYNSRIGPTRALAEAAAQAGVKTFACASAIGIYGADRGDEVLTEESERGTGFLADVVDDWEKATLPASEAGVRVVNVRTGIAMSPRGGALQLLRLVFLTGLGGRLGDGRQWMSWIDLDDLTDIYLAALTDDTWTGPINAVSPNPVRNEEFSKTLGKVLHRPALFPAPSFGPALLLGREGAKEVAFADQRVVPARLTAHGHPFRRPVLEACLRHQLGKFKG
jgi:uncharacterized protein (TIGR01777 family)